MKKQSRRDLKYRLENAKIDFPEQTVRLELYRLASHFIASKTLRDLSDGTDWCPYQPLRDEFQRAEIMRILLYVAISGRLLGDKLKDLNDLDYMEKPAVGILIDDVRKKSEKPLNLRECCNKIIHAKHIVLGETRSRNPYRAFLKPHITLYAIEKRDSGWKAIINVHKFVGEFASLAI